MQIYHGVRPGRKKGDLSDRGGKKEGGCSVTMPYILGKNSRLEGPKEGTGKFLNLR